MNKQSSLYTTIYIIVLVLIVGTALAVTSLALRDRQQDNINADKMRQILASVGIQAEGNDVAKTFNECIISQKVVNSEGNEVEGSAFDINIAEQVKLPAEERKLPVFECRATDGTTTYILPAYGAGLWGPIWGYIALDDNGSTIYGAFFAHQLETPGLGAEIEKPKFRDEFKGLNLFKNGVFQPIEVVKAGQKPAGDADYVNGVSGGTITSKGVGAMIDNSLSPYKAFLEKIRTK